MRAMLAGRRRQRKPCRLSRNNDYDYVDADPINAKDLDGLWGPKWLKDAGRFVKKHRRAIVQGALGFALSAGAGLLAAGICGATAGIGCFLLAGAATRVITGFAARNAADRMMGYRTSGGTMGRRAVADAVGGGFSGAFRGAVGRSPLGYLRKGMAPGAPGPRGLLARPTWRWLG